MAGRMNMLKLLEEVQGLASFPGKPPVPRPSNPLRLQFRGLSARKTANKGKYTLRVDMKDPVDIPEPVAITFLQKSENLPG